MKTKSVCYLFPQIFEFALLLQYHVDIITPTIGMIFLRKTPHHNLQANQKKNEMKNVFRTNCAMQITRFADERFRCETSLWHIDGECVYKMCDTVVSPPCFRPVELRVRQIDGHFFFGNACWAHIWTTRWSFLAITNDLLRADQTSRPSQTAKQPAEMTTKQRFHFCCSCGDDPTPTPLSARPCLRV